MTGPRVVLISHERYSVEINNYTTQLILPGRYYSIMILLLYIQEV